jgi:two-component system, cell cycle sensor histidine kinase and response regulator CckA
MTGSSPRPNVLVVDDDPALRELLSRGLERKGFNVVSAGGADEAIRLAADPEVSIDLIVMDIVLPDSWGAQVAMEQRMFRPDVKVIFISGHTQGDPVFEATQLSDDVRFLPKPFRVDELVALIRETLEGTGPGPTTQS